MNNAKIIERAKMHNIQTDIKNATNGGKIIFLIASPDVITKAFSRCKCRIEWRACYTSAVIKTVDNKYITA